MDVKYAPIIIMVYDRLDHFKNLIASLLNDPLAQYSGLYVISDAAYKEEHGVRIEQVRTYARSITGFKTYTLIENEQNRGANKSYQDILSIVFERHDKVIFFEDDNLVSSHYLTYMNNAFNKYEDNPQVVFVCGYNFPIAMPNNYAFDAYFYPSVCAWGYGFWKQKRLDVYALDKHQMRRDKKTLNKIKETSDQLYYILNSDLYTDRILNDARIGYLMVKNDLVSVFPTLSLVKNTGHDGSGLNCGSNDFYQNQEKNDDFMPTNFPSSVFISSEIKNEMMKYASGTAKDKIKSKLKLTYLKTRRLFNF